LRFRVMSENFEKYRAIAIITRDRHAYSAIITRDRDAYLLRLQAFVMTKSGGTLRQPLISMGHTELSKTLPQAYFMAEWHFRS
jgi:hypothetical protein